MRDFAAYLAIILIAAALGDLALGLSDFWTSHDLNTEAQAAFPSLLIAGVALWIWSFGGDG